MNITQLKEIKTFSALYNLLYQSKIEMVSQVKYRSNYTVIIGDHEQNIFLQIEFDYYPRIDATERYYNGTNYDLGRTVTVYPTRHGMEKLKKFLWSEV